MIEKDSARFPRKWPEYSTGLLEPEGETLRRPETDPHFDRWEVEALGDELATRKYLEPSLSKAGDRQGSNFSRGVAVDAGGGESCGSECSGPSPSGVNADVKDDGALAGGDFAVVLNAVPRDGWSSTALNDIPGLIIASARSKSFCVNRGRCEDADRGKKSLSDEFVMGGSCDEIVEDFTEPLAR